MEMVLQDLKELMISCFNQAFRQKRLSKSGLTIDDKRFKRLTGKGIQFNS